MLPSLNLVIASISAFVTTAFVTVGSSCEGTSQYELVVTFAGMYGVRVVNLEDDNPDTNSYWLSLNQDHEEALASYNRATGVREKPSIFNILLGNSYTPIIHQQFAGNIQVTLYVSLKLEYKIVVTAPARLPRAIPMQTVPNNSNMAEVADQYLAIATLVEDYINVSTNSSNL